VGDGSAVCLDTTVYCSISVEIYLTVGPRPMFDDFDLLLLSMLTELCYWGKSASIQLLSSFPSTQSRGFDHLMV
jgi:hypothetical protein